MFRRYWSPKLVAYYCEKEQQHFLGEVKNSSHIPCLLLWLKSRIYFSLVVAVVSGGENRSQGRKAYVAKTDFHLKSGPLDYEYQTA